ncbi:hypothetical protein [Hydrogenophaga sp.]|uniref:hypothetical protein n=1 Tax=Hydrogenophaga sp. TaxID=1904254 RepID=UPI002719BBFA|nr:hypothetical protein [Hydrogenophaga sp.]MDO9438805.1 hypothetical protein [Hydrogenophaga sp.]
MAKSAYAAIERFALVYLIGVSLSIFARLYFGIGMPWFPQVLLPVAALASAWKFRRDPTLYPTLGAYLLAVAGCAVVLSGVKYFLASKLAVIAQMDGPGLLWSMLRRNIWETLQVAIFLSPWVGRYLARNTTSPRKAGVGAFGLTVGFASVGTHAFEQLRSQDAKLIGPLFAHCQSPEPGQIPSSQVLFLYAELNDDGTLKGLERPVGVRQIVQKTNASLVVVAVNNPSAAIKAAIALPGPKTANIVFTMDRRNQLLPLFMVRLFEEMRNGTDMLSAWVLLAPQGPRAQTADMPATLLAAEGGKIAFPMRAGLPRS